LGLGHDTVGTADPYRANLAEEQRPLGRSPTSDRYVPYCEPIGSVRPGLDDSPTASTDLGAPWMLRLRSVSWRHARYRPGPPLQRAHAECLCVAKRSRREASRGRRLVARMDDR